MILGSCRRLGIERRVYGYDAYFPERREGEERRSGKDRRNPHHEKKSRLKRRSSDL